MHEAIARRRCYATLLLYYFHVFDDKEYIEDHNGVELMDAAEAKKELLRLIRLLPERLIRPGARVALHDEAGNMLDEQWVIKPERWVLSPNTKERYS